MEEAMNDARFSHIRTDKRFRKMPKHIKKVTVDKRFNAMFKDKEFIGNSQLDKRGRPLDLRPAENLRNLYELTSESSEDDDDEGSDSVEVKKSEGETRSFNKNTDIVSNSAIVKKYEGGTRSSDNSTDKDSSEESDDSDDSESDDSSGDQSEDFDHKWEELQKEAPDTDEITHRIAVCNMDWDRIRAEDLFTCFNSFKPADGCIKSVKVYPSEYGLKRMEGEKLNGPPELIIETLPSDAEESEEDTKTSRYHREKLRQYQINRLKYYYAVVDCDSSETANILYEQLNGMEYESSSVRFDLRFIPDDVTFDHEPASVADKVPDPAEYKPRLFVTSALQQVKVNLTWDETDPKRKEILDKAFTKADGIEKDIQNYLASSSGESEEEEVVEAESGKKLTTKQRIDKYRDLLLSLEEKEKEEEESKYEMEITWEPGLKEKTEEIVKDKMKKESLNPFEEMLQKKKEDRKLKRKEKKANKNKSEDESDESEDDNDEEFSSKNTSVSHKKDAKSKQLAELALISDSKKELNLDGKFTKKNKKPENVDFKINVNDPRFSAIYSSPLFNIDPSNPQFKDTEGNRAFIREKQRKLQSTDFHERKRNSKKAKYS